MPLGRWRLGGRIKEALGSNIVVAPPQFPDLLASSFLEVELPSPVWRIVGHTLAWGLVDDILDCCCDLFLDARAPSFDAYDDGGASKDVMIGNLHPESQGAMRAVSSGKGPTASGSPEAEARGRTQKPWLI